MMSINKFIFNSKLYSIRKDKNIDTASSMRIINPVVLGVMEQTQGSVLGPVLFVCYINDMPNTVSSFIYMYADDTKLGRRVTTAEDSKKLQADLDCIQQ